ncbi:MULTISPECIES: hypothetical protein [Streptomyces]|jgi:hypothetical protein|uniref:Uncharacterized protein n=1 Tax=Streptomyces pseudovenezuelae TaxID=67350 RepID=A0ABT6LGS6_9ACTN|nr:hypothetical protein [Streptomyces pseudovenezuelae]MDH6215498.1 hypothetical protein [Streptomyces pseudovenezuelae]
MNRQIRVRVSRRPGSATSSRDSRDARDQQIDRRTPSGRILPY